MNESGAIPVSDGDNSQTIQTESAIGSVIKLILVIYVMYALSRLVLQDQLDSSWFSPNWKLLLVGVINLSFSTPIVAFAALQMKRSNNDNKAMNLVTITFLGLAFTIFAGIGQILFAAVSAEIQVIQSLKNLPLLFGFAIIVGGLITLGAYSHVLLLSRAIAASTRRRTLLISDAATNAVFTTLTTLMGTLFWLLLI